MRRCGTSMENENQIKLDRAAYVFILSQVRKRKLSREQEMFFFSPLNLLQKLRAKALLGC